MSSSTGHLEYSNRRLSRPKSGPKHSAEPDAECSEILVPAPPGQIEAPRAPYGDKARGARQQSILSRYSNIELPEVVAPKPTSTNRPERERILSAEQLKSRESNKYFVPAHARQRLQNEHSNKETETQVMVSSPATKLYTVSHLIFFSILGTLARLGLEAITSYPSAPVTSSVLWPNLAGSLVLGFLAEDQRIFREEWGNFSSPENWSFHRTIIESNDGGASQHALRRHVKIKKTIPLFIGLTTGFCGSCTSFSSFIRDAFLALSNGLPSPSPNSSSIPPRNGGYSLEALLAILIIHITVSLSGLKIGSHLALVLDPATPTLRFQHVRTFLDPMMVNLGIGSWIGAVLLTAFPPHQLWRGRVTCALVFAPLGCLLRFYASKCLNPRTPSFPLGTFAVNMFGTICLGLFFNVQHSRSVAGDVIACQVLQGAMDGFCGCATTVSTWVAELSGLQRRHSYIYGFSSVVVALSFLVIIMGSLLWSKGFQDPACT